MTTHISPETLEAGRSVEIRANKPRYLIKFRADPNVDDVFVETTDPVHMILSCDGNEVEYVQDLERGNVTDYWLTEVEDRKGN